MEKGLFPLGSQFRRHSPSQGGHAGGRGSRYGGRGVWLVTSHQQTGTGSKGLRWRIIFQAGTLQPAYVSYVLYLKGCTMWTRCSNAEAWGQGWRQTCLPICKNEPKC